MVSRSAKQFRRRIAVHKRAVAVASVVAVTGLALLASSMATVNPNLQGDLNGDNKVTISDLSILLSNFNKTGDAADLNGDGKTTIADLSILLSNWGKTYSGGGTTPPPPTPPPTTPPSTPPTTPPTTPPITPPAADRSIKGQVLYVYKPSEWASRPRAIYDYQVGKWYGNWITDIKASVDEVVTAATAVNQLALLSAYNIPGRDCGSYSAGGAGNSAAYRSWIDAFAAGVGSRKAIIFLEADGLAQLDCLNANDQNARIADMAYAVTVFKDKTQASVYVDGGNAGWKSAAEMATRLKKANVAAATGFSLNVSNFKFTNDTVAYGEDVVAALKQQGVSGSRYIIDTSRNGKGPAPDSAESWCNPSGRGLGKRPSTSPDQGANNDAYLWVKTIGESDGTCNDGPAAGQWYPAYAQMLIDNAVY